MTAAPSSAYHQRSSPWGKSPSLSVDDYYTAGGYEGLSGATTTTSSRVGSVAAGSDAASSASSRSCLVLPLFRKNSSGNSHGKRNNTFLLNDNRQQQQQQDGYNGYDNPGVQGVSWERFPYDYSHNTDKDNNDPETTAITASMSRSGLTTTSTSRGGGGTGGESYYSNATTTPRQRRASTPSASANVLMEASSSSSSSSADASGEKHKGTTNGISNTTSSNSNKNAQFLQHLLTPPTPTDRASVPQKRIAYEKEQRAALGARYDGELQGMYRGQEARVHVQQQQQQQQAQRPRRRGLYEGEMAPPTAGAPPPHPFSSSTSSSSVLPNLRSFGTNDEQHQQQQQPPRTPPTSTRTTTSLAAIREHNNAGDNMRSNREPEHDNNSTSNNDNDSPTEDGPTDIYKEFVPRTTSNAGGGVDYSRSSSDSGGGLPMQFQTSTGQAVRGVHHHNNNNIHQQREDYRTRPQQRHYDDDDDDSSEDSESTQSDDELRQMQADLIPNNTSIDSPQRKQERKRVNQQQQQQQQQQRRENNRDKKDRRTSTGYHHQDDRPSPVAAAAAATAAREAAAVRTMSFQSSTASSTSSQDFWNKQQQHPANDSIYNNNVHNHHHHRSFEESDVSHADVDVVRTYSTGASAGDYASSVNEDEKETKEDGHDVNNNDSTIDALNELAMDYVHRNEFGDAIATFMQVLKQQIEVHGDLHPAVASAYHNLGTVHAKRVAALQRQLEEQQQQRSRPNTIGTAPTPVVQLEREQRMARQAALEAFQAAARTARDSLSTEHPNVAVSLVRIGFLLLQSRQYQNAVVTFEEALRIRLDYYGPKHALVANLHNNLGVCHMHLGNFDQGRQSLLDGLAIQRELVVLPSSGTKDVTGSWVHALELADTLFNLGGLSLESIRKLGPDLRRVQEAENAFAEALQIRTQVLGPDDPSVLQLKDMLAMARSIPRPLSPVNVPNGIGYQRSRSGDSPRATRKSPASHSGRRTPAVRNLQGGADEDTSDFRSASPATEASSKNGRSSSVVAEPGRSTVAAEALAGIQERRAAKNSFMPPVEVRVFSDEEDSPMDIGNGGNNVLDRSSLSRTSETRIYMAEHLVPVDSPSKKREKMVDVSQGAVASGRSLDETFDLDTSDYGGGLSQLFPYDAEESCMLNDSGVDSEHGRIHCPSTWEKRTAGRDLVVTRPFRTELRNKARRSDDSISTGDPERDAVMARARAILEAHSPEKSLRPGSDEKVAYDEDFLVEDGLAPLEGSWSSSAGNVSLRHMLADPLNHVPQIHEEASKQLSKQDFEEALELFGLVLDCHRDRYGPVHKSVASALHNLGICHLRAQNHDEALKAFEESARIRKGCLGRDHPHVAISLVKVGVAHLLLRHFEDALWSFREALSVRKRALGPLDPSVARIYNNIGCVHVEFHEFREGRRAFEAALDIQRSALVSAPDSGPLLFGAATTLCNLGYLYRHLNAHERAVLVLREGVELQKEVLGVSHPTVLSTIDNLADCCVNCGQGSDALRLYNNILMEFQVGGRTESLRAEAVLLYKMSRVHRERNDYESQLDSLKLALRSIRAATTNNNGIKTDSLERRILYDLRTCRERLEKEEMNWV